MANPFDEFDAPAGNPFDEFDAPTKPRLGPPEELTFGEKLMSGVELPKWMDNIRGSAPLGFLRGTGKAVAGAVQLGANLLPDSTGIPQSVNEGMAAREKEYQDARAARGRTGFDWADLGGQILSPANAAVATKIPAVVSTLGRAGMGAAVGAGTSAVAPVENADKGYWGQKAVQVAVGAGTGAILSPILGKVADVVMRKLGVGRTVSPRASSHDVDGAIAESLKDMGQTLDDVPPDQLAALRGQVTEALTQGKQMDPAAALRKADFDALGIKPTLGQITRDPKQFAREQNLRGVEGVGDDLLARFNSQERDLQGKLPVGSTKNAYQAGTQLSESLGGIDKLLNKEVSARYGAARASAGKDLDIPLQGLAQDYGDILGKYSENIRKSLPLDAFESLGIGKGTQQRVFNFEEADKLLKVINANKSNDPGVQAALGELRGAVRKAVESADTAGGPYAPAVAAAAERFKMHDAIPALKAAARGTAEPDTFVKNFIVNGKTNDVKGLSKVLKQADPEAWQEARAQLADELRRAGFGEVNAATGDAPFSPSKYMQTIRRLGVDKLGAFFDAEEMAQIVRVGRVGADIKSAPPSAPVSRSNSNTAVVNYLAQFPPFRGAAAVVNNVARPIQQNAAVRNALAAEIPMTDAPLTEAQRNWLAYILAGGAAGGGMAAGAIGQ